ncbi:MAG: hypothetical protein PUE05_05260 [bacterium]|nr:hypothetical protein [bacterium]MDY4185845.1 hypothetical protein [Sodaliphilus sp.]
MKQTILLALLIITGSSVFAQKGVDLGLSVEWADCNLGATKCTEFGNYYYWGKEHINSDISGTSLDYAKKETGVWRMPTLKEYQELINNCSIVTTSIDNVRGKKIIGKNGNSIFLPASGSYMIFSDGDKIDNGVGESVNYWLSTPASDSKNCLYNISDDMSNVLTYNRYDFHSMCIRPVRDKNYHKTSGQKKTYLVIDNETNDTIKEVEVTFFDDYIQIEEDKYKFSKETTLKVGDSNFLADFYDGEPVVPLLLPIVYKFSYHFTKNRSLGIETYYVTMGDELHKSTCTLILK